MNYYNEWDPQAAAWLRELIAERLIPRGLVDERSITEVKAEDLEGFNQCHFFAGIGGWPLALQVAGVDHRTPLWTGSPPCQPFSAAGKQLGQFDPRHLAPVFLDLISQCRPPVLFGEQVAPAIAKSWMCDLQTHLEGEDYAVGFAVLPACGVGAPHKRERLFFGAHQLADTDGEGRWDRRERERSFYECNGAEASERGDRGRGAKRLCTSGTTNPHHSFWSDSDWLGCRDGKFRPVEPGTFPLANGVPARVGRLRDGDLQSNPQKNRVMRLRGYGNAIVPQVAAEFVKAFMEAKNAI